MTDWEPEADLARVRAWVPREGAEKPKLDADACDIALACVQRLLKGEAADVDGCPDVFVADPLVPSQAVPVELAPPPLTQAAAAADNQDGEDCDGAHGVKRLRNEAALSKADFAGNFKMAQNILTYLLKSTAARITIRVILDAAKLRNLGRKEDLEGIARKVFRLTRLAGLGALGVQGGTWTGLRPPEADLPEVLELVAEICGGTEPGREAALRQRNEASNFDLEQCKAALELLREDSP